MVECTTGSLPANPYTSPFSVASTTGPLVTPKLRADFLSHALPPEHLEAWFRDGFVNLTGSSTMAECHVSAALEQLCSAIASLMEVHQLHRDAEAKKKLLADCKRELARANEMVRVRDLEVTRLGGVEADLLFKAVFMEGDLELERGASASLSQ